MSVGFVVAYATIHLTFNVIFATLRGNIEGELWKKNNGH